LSRNIVQKINVEIPADVTDEVLEEIVQTKQFAYQLNESTYIGNEATLVAFMQVSDDVEVLECIFFCKFLKGNATGRIIFDVINNFNSVIKNSNANTASLYVQMAQQRRQGGFQTSFRG
jgi:hypothetical protein